MPNESRKDRCTVGRWALAGIVELAGQCLLVASLTTPLPEWIGGAGVVLCAAGLCLLAGATD